MASGAQMMTLLSSMLLLSVTFRAATAKEFIVGGDSGWTLPSTKNGLDYKAFGNTTSFVVGDTLVERFCELTECYLRELSEDFIAVCTCLSVGTKQAHCDEALCVYLPHGSHN